MAIYHCDMFIVPNLEDIVNEDTINKEYTLAGQHNTLVSRYQIDPSLTLIEGDRPVQIWFTSEDSENWSDHGSPLPGVGNFIAFLPERVLKGMNDGDSITIDAAGHTVIAKANQSDYRYRNFGTFEEVFYATTL